MKSVTVKQIQRLDEVAIGRYGVPSIALMENAGRCVANEIVRQLKRVNKPKVCIFCGIGNNAGDGFVVARHLINAGVQPKIFLLGNPAKLKNDAKVNYAILKKLKYPMKVLGEDAAYPHRAVATADLLVDAIFGVGLNREIGESFHSVIERMNASGKKIIAVDIPSGLDGTTGKIYGTCVKAKMTVTFSFAKKGFFKAEGPKHTGKVIVVDIGIPKKLCIGQL